MLWQLMLSRMRKAKSDHTLLLLKALEGMELNSKYPLNRFVISPRLNVVSNSKKMVVRFHTTPPHIKNGDTKYSYELFLLLVGSEEKDDRLMTAGSDWIDIKAVTGGEIGFAYELPVKVTYYLLCLHFNTGKDREATGTLASRGMRIVNVGEI